MLSWISIQPRGLLTCALPRRTSSLPSASPPANVAYWRVCSSVKLTMSPELQTPLLARESKQLSCVLQTGIRVGIQTAAERRSCLHRLRLRSQNSVGFASNTCGQLSCSTLARALLRYAASAWKRATRAKLCSRARCGQRRVDASAWTAIM